MPFLRGLKNWGESQRKRITVFGQLLLVAFQNCLVLAGWAVSSCPAQPGQNFAASEFPKPPTDSRSTSRLWLAAGGCAGDSRSPGTSGHAAGREVAPVISEPFPPVIEIIESSRLPTKFLVILNNTLLATQTLTYFFLFLPSPRKAPKEGKLPLLFFSSVICFLFFF